jgi:hypothetical protein
MKELVSINHRCVHRVAMRALYCERVNLNHRPCKAASAQVVGASFYRRHPSLTPNEIQLSYGWLERV